MNHTEQRFDPDKDTIVPKNSRPTSAQRKKRAASGSGQRKKNSTGQTKQKNLYESFGAGETSGSIHAPAAPSEDIGGI